MKIFHKILGVGLIVFGIVLCLLLIFMTTGGPFRFQEPEFARLWGISQWVLLISGGWCMAAAAWRALGERPVGSALLAGCGCFLAAALMHTPGSWACALGLAITACAAAYTVRAQGNRD